MSKETVRKVVLTTAAGATEGAAIGVVFAADTFGASIPVGAVAGGLTALVSELAGRAKKVAVETHDKKTGSPVVAEAAWIEQWDTKRNGVNIPQPEPVAETAKLA